MVPPVRLRIAAVVVAVALAGSACSGGGHALAGPSGGDASTSASSGTATTEGGIVVTAAGVASVKSGNIGPIRLGDHSVVYPYSDAPDGNWMSVATVDLEALEPHRVAHSHFDLGLINWVAAVGDWVAYVDQSARQSDSDTNVLWRVHAINTASGEDRLLATNGDVPDPYVPIVQGQDGFFFWTQAEPDRTAKEMVWKPGAARPTTLLRHTEIGPGSESLSNGNLVYLGPAAHRASRKRTIGGDCWQVPLTGGVPVPITQTALAMDCEADDGELVWTEHIDPETDDVPPEGVFDDPYELWTETIDGGRPMLLHRGYISSWYPSIGDGFVLWQRSDGTRIVQNLSNGRTHRLSKSDRGYQPAVTSGSYVAGASGNPGQPATIHIYKVRTEQPRQ